MNKIVYRPPRERLWSSRYFVGFRLAWLYRDGTVIENKGKFWMKYRDPDSDSWPWWQPISERELPR